MLANFPYRRAGQSPLAQIVHPEGLITVNKIFRWLTLLLGYLFLAVLWQLSQNGRYALHDIKDGVILLDTRTGEVSWPKDTQRRDP